MRLSDEPEYRLVIPAILDGDFTTARANLKTLISRAQAEGDTLTTGYLLQVLGDMEAHAGDTKMAHSLHEQALAMDPNNPLPLLLYAQGLLRAFHQPDLARSRLAEAEVLVKSGCWKPGKDEPSREWYEREFKNLRSEIIRKWS